MFASVLFDWFLLLVFSKRLRYTRPGVGLELSEQAHPVGDGAEGSSRHGCGLAEPRYGRRKNRLVMEHISRAVTT